MTTSEITIKEALSYSQQLTAVSDSARIDAEVLLSAVLKKDRAYCYTWPEKYLSVEEEAAFKQKIARRLQGEPIAYIVGEKEFWSLTLAVNDSTLIPRPDTELLVERVLAHYADDLPSQQRTMIDLGTGTGALALSLASEKPHWNIIAIDNNPEACALADANRRAHALDNVRVLCSDWLQNLEPQQVDCIVSNPPYIDKNDRHLQQGDVRFEPHSALVAENKGLADIETLSRQAIDYLLPEGWLLVEHGYQQATEVANILRGNGLSNCASYSDLAGQPRVTVGQKRE